MPPQSLLRGALLGLAAESVFATMAATIKLVSADLPSESVVFFRNLLGLLVLLPWLARAGWRALASARPGLQVLRSLAGVGAMYCYFFALAHIPLAEAVLLLHASPLFIPAIASLWLGERVPPSVRWAVLIGFAGVALILRPGFAQVSPWALLALLGGALAALAKVTIRRMGETEPPARIVFYFALTGTLVSALPQGASGVAPPAGVWAPLLAVGLLATAGQVLLTRAYTLAPAARLGPLTYSSVLLASLYGWWLWGEVPGPATFAGAALVVLAGLLATRPVPLSGPAGAAARA